MGRGFTYSGSGKLGGDGGGGGVIREDGTKNREMIPAHSWQMLDAHQDKLQIENLTLD